MKNETVLRTLGVLLIILGLLLVIIGLFSGTIMSCPAGGCPPAVLQQTSASQAILVYLGMALIVAGVIVLLESRRSASEGSRS